jgi:diphthamide biosynthesis methyltransferase
MQALLQEETYGKPIIIAERGTVETGAETDILTPAQTENVALLVVGDALWCVLPVLLFLHCYDYANCKI